MKEQCESIILIAHKSLSHIMCLIIKKGMKVNMLNNYEHYPVYNGSDLGVSYIKDKSAFRLWAPTADKVYLRLYKKDNIEEYEMQKSAGGTWYIELSGDLKGLQYTYKILRNSKEVESVDPYAKALTANGAKSVIIDLRETNPKDWENDIKPTFNSPTDAIIYEIHVRDFSIHNDSGIINKGKYLAFTEGGTVGPNNVKTGLDHLKELGITHVHILPIQDFASVDEIKGGYNWGYDPYHYFVPEGSYSKDPSDPLSRIKEVKEMVMSLHKAGIRVIMDVVYNHTHTIGNSIFDKIEPGYFYRHNPDGSYSNGSGCGNETASERPMMRKLMIDSLKYWIEEYHIDGFRFDLLALHDIDTVREIEKEIHLIDPSILLYGEPWTGGPSALPVSKQIVKGAQHGLKVSVFNDNIRNGIKGLPDDDSKGFATGQSGLINVIKQGIVGGIKYNDNIGDFTLNPSESINYVSCHDNLTLWDKIEKSNHYDDENTRIAMDKLCNMIVLTSQGIPFIHAGEEMLRTKKGCHNSYNAGDDINAIDWSRKAKYHDVFEYYKGLISLRRKHPAFRMKNAEDIRQNLSFIESPDGTIVFTLDGRPCHDSFNKIIVIYNPLRNDVKINLPEGNWHVVVDDMKAGTTSIDSGNWKIENNTVTVPPICGMVLYSLN